MNEKKKSAIEVDYDNISVPRIMEQIKQKAAEGARLESETPSGAGGKAVVAPEIDLGEEPAAPGRGGKARKVLLKIMSPFRPLIKLLILPVYEEQQQTVRILHQTNKRLDYLFSIHEKERRLILDRQKEYTKLLHLLGHNLVVELSKLKIEEETLKTDVRLMEKDFEHLRQRQRALEQEVFK
jgi:hypothetical protein